MSRRAGLRAAFLAAAYGPPGERLHLTAAPGDAPPWTARLRRWAIVTAWNPGACQAPLAANHAAGQRLRAEVQAAGWAVYASVNGQGKWAEESLLIAGASLAQTLDWTRTYGQAAALHGSGSRVALLWEDGTVERYWARSEGGGPGSASAALLTDPRPGGG